MESGKNYFRWGTRSPYFRVTDRRPRLARNEKRIRLLVRASALLQRSVPLAASGRIAMKAPRDKTQADPSHQSARLYHGANGPHSGYTAGNSGFPSPDQDTHRRPTPASGAASRKTAVSR